MFTERFVIFFGSQILFFSTYRHRKAYKCTFKCANSIIYNFYKQGLQYVCNLLTSCSGGTTHKSLHFFTYLTALDGTVLKNNFNQIKENNFHIHVTLTQCVSQRACTASQTERTNFTKHLTDCNACWHNQLYVTVSENKEIVYKKCDCCMHVQ